MLDAPAQSIKTRRFGDLPVRKSSATSFGERHNLTIRMGNRRFTRLTNAFSKKVENHEHMLALFFMYYNFCRIHKSLRCTPAMAAGVSTRVWELTDLVDLLDSQTEKAA